jgi:hypothetical protein
MVKKRTARAVLTENIPSIAPVTEALPFAKKQQQDNTHFLEKMVFLIV